MNKVIPLNPKKQKVQYIKINGKPFCEHPEHNQCCMDISCTTVSPYIMGVFTAKLHERHPELPIEIVDGPCPHSGEAALNAYVRDGLL